MKPEDPEARRKWWASLLAAHRLDRVSGKGEP
jgi:hypothetical protein